MPSILTPTSRADLEGMTCIAHVSSAEQGKRMWTELSIWYQKGAERPFITVVEARATVDRASGLMGYRNKFTAFCRGTIGAAIAVLDVSDLRNELCEAISLDSEAFDNLYPGSDIVRMQKAEQARAARWYGGPDTLTGALAWLYPELAKGSANQLAAKFEADFGIGERTTRKIIAGERAGIAAPSWVAALVAALRYFDRKAWERDA